jgi:lysophospholipase L1-like esterase
VVVNTIAIVTLGSIAEVYLRLQGVPRYVRTYPGQYLDDPNGRVWWAEADPKLGWTADRTQPDINREGFRSFKDFADARFDTEKPRVMVLGDSFAYGAGLPAEFNFPSRLEKRLGSEFEIYNLGVPGWGIDQMYLAYQQHRDVIRPKYVLLTFIDDDVSRVLESYRVWERLTKPSFALEKGALVSRGLPTFTERLLNKLCSRSVLFGLVIRELYISREARPIVGEIFREMSRQASQRGEYFAVVRSPVPTKVAARYASIPTWIAAVNQNANFFDHFLKGMNAVYFDPLKEFQSHPNWELDLYLRDGHLSAEGHEFLARQIALHIFKRNPDF